MANGDLTQEINKLKTADAKPILAHGGASFARGLIAQNLVDEYALTVHPTVLGKARVIFSDLLAPRPPELLSAKTFPGGIVAQIYRGALIIPESCHGLNSDYQPTVAYRPGAPITIGHRSTTAG